MTALSVLKIVLNPNQPTASASEVCRQSGFEKPPNKHNRYRRVHTECTLYIIRRLIIRSQLEF